MIKLLGFFKELENGFGNDKSIKDFISKQSGEYEAEIVNYLQSGKTLVKAIGFRYDTLSDKKIIAGSPDILTDGKWVWSGLLSFYVNKYHIELPIEFIEDCKINHWKVPNLDKSQLNDINIYLSDVAKLDYQ
jgi:hypothetical protein